MPAVSHRWRCYHPRILEQWQIQRAHLAHYYLKSRSYNRVCGCVRNNGSGRPLCFHGHLYHRHIRRQLTHSWVVRKYLRSDEGEEGCRNRYCDDGYECVFHLVRDFHSRSVWRTLELMNG